MADVSIEQLAKLVRTTPERLLEQLKKAGVEAKSTDQMITPDEKRKLLLFLKSSHGDEAKKSPRKITLKRKKVSVVKSGRKSVNVEVRAKRTYQKPTLEDKKKAEEEAAALAEAEAQAAAAKEAEDKAAIEAEVSGGDKQADKPKKTKTKKDDKKPVAAKVEAPTKEVADKHGRTAGGRRDSRSHRKGFDKYEREELHIRSHGGKRKKKSKGFKSSANATETLEHGFAKPTAPVVRDVSVPESITVGDLAQRMSVKAAEVIKTMMGMGAMVTINQIIDQDTAVLLVEEMGHKAVPLSENAVEEGLMQHITTSDAAPVPRAPVVTIMGHVDHGKTSLLDFIRRTKVTSGEAGGITQHIGAYHVDTDKGTITFLDTPGHEAFTAMRARGVKCTDIVVLVVAADDGVMPQTIEAIQHAKAAEVPIVVAVNKIDKPEADPERIKSELAQHEVMSEEWGGETIFQNISAKTGQGVDELLDAILLQAEVLELTAVAEGAASGMVIESRLDKGRGPVATILVMQGTLNKGDVMIAGREYGRIRAMIGDDGQPKETVGPAMPVEILGLSGTPAAGDEMHVAPSERKAREISQFRQGKYREVRLAKQQSARLDGIFDQLSGGKGQKKALNIVLKADVQGSVEAISDALTKLSNDEVKVKIVANTVGGITESDVNLAIASDAIIIGFNVRAGVSARALIEKEGVDLHYYSVIYDLINEVKSALTGMLEARFEDKIVGLAEVREVFRSSKFGAVAGCMVVEGIVKRNLPIRVLRDDVVIFEGELESLRRFKEDAGEVRNGMECGIGVKNYNDVKAGDQIECYERVQVARTL